jgi:hypothetical protein
VSNLATRASAKNRGSRRSIRMVALVAVCGLGLAACGGSTSTNSAPASAPVSAPAPVQTAAQAGSGFYNTTTLQNDLVSVYNTTPPVSIQAQ